ncbi:NHL repeat-containing protein [Gemmatimonadota bacterium]
MNRSTACCISLLSLLLQLAIPVSAQQRPWRGSIEDVDGVTVVRNPAEGIWERDTALTITFERLLSIGDLDPDEDYLFSWVEDVTTDPDGNIYVCDSREHRIQVFDPEGRYLRTIGREGRGPGEIMRPKAVGIGPDGRLYVQDDLNYRISIFQPGGRFVDSFHYDGFMGEHLSFDGKGNILLHRWTRSDDQEGDLPVVSAYSGRGRLTGEFGERTVELQQGIDGRPKFASNGFEQFEEDLIVIFPSWPYRLEFYRGGALERIVERESPIFPAPRIVEAGLELADGSVLRQPAVRKRSSISGVFPLSEDYFMVVVQDRGRGWRDSTDPRDFTLHLDLYDREGRYLRTVPWDWEQRGLIRYADGEGNLYSGFGSDAGVPGVTKWKVIMP